MNFCDADTQITCGFIFLVAPLDYSYPVKILHISPAPNGCYSDNIECIASNLMAQLRQYNIIPLFKATDGDRGVSAQHETFFETFIATFNGNFYDLITNIYTSVIQNGTFIPISDPLHFMKCFRGRLLDHPVIPFPGADPFSVDSLQDILDLGQALSDRSSLSRMRDSYVIKLFSMNVVCKLLNLKKYSPAFVFMAFSSILCSIFSSNITQEFRLFLLEISFKIFLYMLHNISQFKKSNVTEKWTKKSSMITVAESHYFKRILNTIAGLAIAVAYGPHFIRLDSIGTHLVENAIGIARSASFDPRWEKIIYTYSTSELRKQIAQDYNLTLIFITESMLEDVKPIQKMKIFKSQKAGKLIGYYKC